VSDWLSGVTPSLVLMVLRTDFVVASSSSCPSLITVLTACSSRVPFSAMRYSFGSLSLGLSFRVTASYWDPVLTGVTVSTTVKPDVEFSACRRSSANAAC